MKIRIPLGFVVSAFVVSLSACASNANAPAQGSGGSGASGTTSSSGGGANTGGSTASSTSSSGGGNTGGSNAGGSTGSGGGTLCGGLKSLLCAADEWCDYPADDCGGTDGTGVCVKRPVGCNGPPPPGPVCGCNNTSYPDACHAEWAGVDVRASGGCVAPEPFPCGPTLTCTTGQEYCEQTSGIVVQWQCVPLPASCLPPNVADCACMPIAPDCGSCSGPTGQLTESHGCG